MKEWKLYNHPCWMIRTKDSQLWRAGFWKKNSLRIRLWSTKPQGSVHGSWPGYVLGINSSPTVTSRHPFLVGGFKSCFLFSPLLWGKMNPIWRAYFWKGLKPRTNSWCFFQLKKSWCFVATLKLLVKFTETTQLRTVFLNDQRYVFEGTPYEAV